MKRRLRTVTCIWSFVEYQVMSHQRGGLRVGVSEDPVTKNAPVINCSAPFMTHQYFLSKYYTPRFNPVRCTWHKFRIHSPSSLYKPTCQVTSFLLKEIIQAAAYITIAWILEKVSDLYTGIRFRFVYFLSAILQGRASCQNS